MRDERDLERLQRQVERARTLLHRSEMKVEKLAASMHEMDKVKAGFSDFSPGPDAAMSPLRFDRPAMRDHAGAGAALAGRA